MPLYRYTCDTHGEPEDLFNRVSDRHTAAPVCRCGQVKALEIMPTMVQGDIQPYQAMTGDKMGQTIGSRRQHKEFLKRNRLVEVGDAPIRPTPLRPTVKKGSVARELKRAIAQHTMPDLRKGGLKERHG